MRDILSKADNKKSNKEDLTKQDKFVYDLHFMVPFIKHKTPKNSAVVSDEEINAMLVEPPISLKWVKLRKRI